MILKLIAGIVIGLAAVAGAVVASGGGAFSLSVLTIFAPVILVPLGVLIAGLGPKALGEVALVASKGGSEGEKRAALAALRMADKGLVLSGSLGFLLHFVGMLTDLSEKSALWPNFAWASAPALLALVAHVLLVSPLANLVREAPVREASAESSKPGTITAIRFLPGAVLGLVGLVVYCPIFVTKFIVYIDLSSLLIAVFVPIAAIVAGFHAGSLKQAWKALRDPESDAGSLAKAYRTCRFLSRAFFSAALVGMATGFVLVLWNMLELSKLGPSVALLGLSALWTLIECMLAILPLEANAAWRLARRSDSGKD